MLTQSLSLNSHSYAYIEFAFADSSLIKGTFLGNWKSFLIIIAESNIS